MRVISGYAKGHKLTPPTSLNIRPTTDRIKESIFNVIQEDLNGTHFLDLFSGTGAIGIEALSRGAKSCIFVDKSKESIEIINKNITHVSKAIKTLNYQILNSDIIEALNSLKSKKFNIIFMDPPYNQDIVNTTLKAIFKNELLSESGFIVVEQSKNESLPLEEEFEIFKVKKYGLSKIIFLKPTEEV